MSLQQHVNKLPQLSFSFSLGKGIDNIYSFISSEASKDKIEDLLRKWASGNQPYVFGKSTNKKIKGLDLHLSIINSPRPYNGDGHLLDFLRSERVRFKEHAGGGEISTRLTHFIHPQFTFARPSEELTDTQKYICSPRIPECCPIKEGAIYTESVSSRDKDGLKTYKVGVNTFYSFAHRIRDHDRRTPEGIFIPVNVLRHFMRLAIEKSFYKDQEQVLAGIRNMTIQSVDKGGYSHPEGISTMQHLEFNLDRFGCPVHTGNSFYYSGFYHTDVLTPRELTKDERLLYEIENSDPMIFDWNVLFCVSLEEFPIDDPYYGEFIDIPVDDISMPSNPFQPRRLGNKPLYEKGDD